jgi:alkylation response protein AidB-like acyl-CoA dehydrogenase
MTGALVNAEVDLFVATTRKFLDKEVPIERVRQFHSDGVAFEREWWRRAAELGWTGLLVPEELGGGSVSGDGVADLALVAEQVGRSVAPGPLNPVSVVLAGLVEASNRSDHRELCTALVDGTVIAAWAVDEPGAPFGADPATTAAAVPDGYRITGTKDRVEAGATCDYFLVTANADDATRQFLVPADAPGVTVEPAASIDLVRDYAIVRFDGVQVSSASAVGTATETPGVIARQTLIAQLLQCAEIVGALDVVFEMTVEWARHRHSFGRPLSSYQALKHRFADMKMQLEACRAIVATAVGDISQRTSSAAATVSAAKAYVGEHSVHIVQDCIQMHGGIGVTWEHDLHVYLRRIELDRTLYGTTEEHQERVYAYFEEMEIGT